MVHMKGKAEVTSTRRESMDPSEQRRAEERRRRTERQREKRERERICGYCRQPASAGVIEWYGRSRPLLIPICFNCLAKLEASWRDMEEVGPWCSVDERRPCPDCPVESSGEKSETGFLRRLFLG